MNATDFTYDGQTLSSFHMMPCSFNGHEDDAITIGSDTEYADARPYDSYLWHYHGGQYSAPLTITVQIGPDRTVSIGNGAYTYGGNHYITYAEERAINKWLSPRQGFKELIVPFVDGVSSTVNNLYFFAHVTRMEKIRFGGHCLGFEVEFTTNAPYAFTEEKSWTPPTWTISEKIPTIASYSGTLTINTDSSDWIYPRIVIECKSDIASGISGVVGAVRVRNYQTDWHSSSDYTMHSQCRFTQVYDGETIVINKDYEGVTTTNTAHNIIDDFDYDYSWFHLVDGRNICAVSANCNDPSLFPHVTFYYREARKVGV